MDTTPSIELPCISGSEDKTNPLKNRIRKNYQHVRKWAKRAHTNCFRIYDRDIKEYPVAIDFYDGRFCVHYFGDEDNTSALEKKTKETLHDLFGAPEDAFYERQRIRRKKTEQYEKRAEAKEFFTVMEHGIRFKINLKDYLDTGLFLDHRQTRQVVASLAKNKRLLNLFAYTCSFSVHAAVAGATFTKSVDLSKTYTDWGRENFQLNSIPLTNHEIIRADCLKFLDEEIDAQMFYDVIVLDPPTLSRSKKMERMFDLQRDYAAFISKALKLLANDGTLFFSTNARDFKFDTTFFSEYTIQDISKKTLPIDFHSPKTHRCWKIQR
jgi:23S rRNA (cytosine1962-C5)-methyltransferase